MWVAADQLKLLHIPKISGLQRQRIPQIGGFIYYYVLREGLKTKPETTHLQRKALFWSDKFILFRHFYSIGAGVNIQFHVYVFDVAAHGFKVDK